MGAVKCGKRSRKGFRRAVQRSVDFCRRSNPALLGVGYIIGPRIASLMCAGGVIAYLVLIPAIKFFGELRHRHRASRNHADRRNVAGRCPRSLCSLHRRGRSRRRRDHQPASIAAAHLARHARGLADFRGTKAAPEAVLRTDRDLSMKVRDHRMHCHPRRHHGRATVEPAMELVRRPAHCRVWFSFHSWSRRG